MRMVRWWRERPGGNTRWPAARESWFPKFFYYGCRYLQVECQSPAGEKLPVVKSLEGMVVHSASEPVGEFECSNALFNRIRKLVRWAQRSNMMSLMTDCPHRETARLAGGRPSERPGVALRIRPRATVHQDA